MATDTYTDNIYEEARKRVKAKRYFWVDLILYAVVNINCFLIWILGDKGFPWFLWVLVPWSVVIILPHYLLVYVYGGKALRTAIEQEAERIRKEQEE